MSNIKKYKETMFTWKYLVYKSFDSAIKCFEQFTDDLDDNKLPKWVKINIKLTKIFSYEFISNYDISTIYDYYTISQFEELL